MKNIFLAGAILFLFNCNLFAQIIINETIELNPVNQFSYLQMSKGDGWWIDTCYIENYDSSEVELTFTPASIEPGETTVMTVDYNEDMHNFLERNITLEPNLGTLVRMPVGGYKYYAPTSTPGDSALVVRIYYEQFHWYCAYGDQEVNRRKTSMELEDSICGCPIGPYWTEVERRYGTDSIIIAWDSLDVKVEPDTVYPGGTVQVVIKKRLPDGTLIDFPSEQTYEIAKLEGCLSGNIVVDQDSGSYFFDVSQPIYFAVADSLVGDSAGTVLLQVGLVDNTEKPGLENKPIKIESNDCFTGNFQSESKDKTNLTINYVFRIDWNAITYPINSVPEMPDNLSIWVRPNFFSGIYFLDWDLEVKWVSTEQNPDKTFSYTFNDQTIGYSADGVELELPQTDETIIGGDEITLTVRYTDNYFTDEEITKKLAGMKILGTNDENNVQVVNDYIANHEFPEIDLPLSELVTLQDQRKQMQIIVKKESSHFQFFDIRYEFMPHGPDDIGYPNMNPKPYDWGLCQLSKAEPSLGVIWNWKENINAGIHFLWTEKYDQLKRDNFGGGFYEIKERLLKKGIEVRNLNREEFLKWLSQRYKGGHYFTGYDSEKIEDGVKGSWVQNPNYKYYEYGDDFWERFDQ